MPKPVNKNKAVWEALLMAINIKDIHQIRKDFGIPKYGFKNSKDSYTWKQAKPVLPDTNYQFINLLYRVDNLLSSLKNDRFIGFYVALTEFILRDEVYPKEYLNANTSGSRLHVVAGIDVIQFISKIDKPGIYLEIPLYIKNEELKSYIESPEWKGLLKRKREEFLTLFPEKSRKDTLPKTTSNFVRNFEIKTYKNFNREELKEIYTTHPRYANPNETAIPSDKDTLIQKIMHFNGHKDTTQEIIRDIKK